MTENQNQETDSWKTQTYITGTVVGGVLGFISAYLFARAAEENNDDGKPEKIPTTTLIGLLLSMMSLLRQIAESGKKKK